MDTKLFVRKQPGGLFAIIDRGVFPSGDIWWVNSDGGTDSAGNGKNPDSPFDSLEYAAETAASAGDTIYVMAGHTETITTLTLALAGLTIIGLGGRTRKPQILVDAEASHVTITAADTVIENLTFLAGFLDVTKCINVAAAGVEIRGCNFEENTTNENFLIAILTTAAGDDLTIEGNLITTIDAQATEGIEIVGACNRVIIKDNYIKGPYSVSAISATTVACLDMQIIGNRIINTLAGNDLAGCIDLVAASTGIMAHNDCYMEDDTDILTAIDAGNLGRVRNLVANEYGQEAHNSAEMSA